MPIKTSHRHINNELFNQFLKEFCYYSDPESANNNNVVIDQSGLDEYRIMISQMKTNNQNQATKFASYLENYAKSFRFNYSEPSIFEFISNQMEKPEIAESLSSSSKRKVTIKKADEIILKNKEQKYADVEKKDKNVLASVEDMCTIEKNFQKLNSFVLTSLNVCKVMWCLISKQKTNKHFYYSNNKQFKKDLWSQVRSIQNLFGTAFKTIRNREKRMW